MKHSMAMRDMAQIISDTAVSNQDHRNPFETQKGNLELKVTGPNFTTVQPKLNAVAGGDDRPFEIRNDPSTASTQDQTWLPI